MNISFWDAVVLGLGFTVGQSLASIAWNFWRSIINGL